MAQKQTSKSPEEIERTRQKKRQAKRFDKATIHYAWTFGVLAIAFCLAVFFPWPGLKVALVMATLWATFTPDGLEQSDRDEATLSSLVFVVRTFLLGIAGLMIGSFEPTFFTYFGGVMIALLILSFCGYLLMQEENHKKKLAIIYAQAQSALSGSPNDPDLRQAALQAGRAYYSAMRGNGLITIYDEAAINNDIQACLGGDRLNE